MMMRWGQQNRAGKDLRVVESDARDLLQTLDPGRAVKMRSPAEILANYNKKCQQYRKLQASGSKNRDDLLLLYTEIKLLGWVLGKSGQMISRDTNG